MKTEKKKRGRPKIDDPRKNMLRVRLNKEESYILDQICVEMDATKSEAIRYILLNYMEKWQ